MLFRTRTIIITALCIISFQSGMQAQSDYKPETWFGVNGGTTLSMVYFKPMVGQSYLIGYHGGLVFKHIAEKSLGVQAEFNYSQRGWAESNGIYSRRMDYIEIPFLSHIHFGKKLQFYMNIGPKVGYYIGDFVRYNSNGIPDEEQQKLTVSQKFDYGFCGGPGLLYKFGGQSIQLDIRGNYSISNFFPDDTRAYFDNTNHINASVSLAWMFKVK
jgi:hypothetical protein